MVVYCESKLRVGFKPFNCKKPPSTCSGETVDHFGPFPQSCTAVSKCHLILVGVLAGSMCAIMTLRACVHGRTYVPACSSLWQGGVVYRQKMLAVHNTPLLCSPCAICMRKEMIGKETESLSARTRWLPRARRATPPFFCFVFQFFIKTMRALDEKQRKNKVQPYSVSPMVYFSVQFGSAMLNQ